jgi:hypothetical protein
VIDVCNLRKPKRRLKRDLTGMVFGRLTVKEFLGVSGKGEAWYECDCSCGKTKKTSSADLLKHNTKSCGCLISETAKRSAQIASMAFQDKSNRNAKQYIGKKFYRLFVLGVYTKRQEYYFECVCECGKIKNIRKTHVIHGVTKSCGCLRVEATINRNKKNIKHGRCTKENLKEYNKEYGKTHRWKYRRKRAKDLSDGYMKILLLKGTNIKSSEVNISSELIELKKLQIQLKREVKNVRNKSNYCC